MSVLGRYFLKLKNLFYVLKKQVLFSPSPEQTALSILFGFYLGVFPIVGTMTILCLTAAFTFRLNYFITLAINYLVAPLQLVLIVPFVQIGSWLTGVSENNLSQSSIASLSTPKDEDILSLSINYISDGIFCWAIFSLTTGFFLYQLLLLLNQAHKKTSVV